jgi:hypothetical protein
MTTTSSAPVIPKAAKTSGVLVGGLCHAAHTNSAPTATRKTPTQASPSPDMAIHATTQSAEPASTPQPSIHQPRCRMTHSVPAAMASRYPNRTGVLGVSLPMIAGLTKPPMKASPATRMPCRSDTPIAKAVRAAAPPPAATFEIIS